jgi:hypothetical protein
MKKLLALTIILGTLSSCSSSKPTRSKVRERAERMTNSRPQYAFINNQIIIFENNY